MITPQPRILVTGGCGFVGLAIVKAITVDLTDIVLGVADIDSSRFTKLIEINDNIKTFVADVTKPESIGQAIESFKPTVVVHTAGLVPSLAERYGRRLQKLVYTINIDGTRNTLNAAVDSGATGFIYTSSYSAVTDDLKKSYINIDETWPTSKKSLIYGESKAIAEDLVLKANAESFSTCVLRPSMVCGPGDISLIPSIHACIEKKETPYIIGRGDNHWDVTYVDNVADAHVLAIKNLMSTKTAAGEVFFIHNNEPVIFRTFSLAVWKQFGHIPSREIRIPILLAWLVGLIAEVITWMSGNPATLSRGSVQEAWGTKYANGRKAREILGYEPRIGLERAIELSCQDYSARLEKAIVVSP